MNSLEKLYNPSDAAVEVLNRIKLEGAKSWGLRCDIANNNSEEYSNELTDLERFMLAIYGPAATAERYDKFAQINKAVDESVLSDSPIIVVKGSLEHAMVQYAHISGIYYATGAGSMHTDNEDRLPKYIRFDVRAVGVRDQLLSYVNELREDETGEKHETSSGFAYEPNDKPRWLTFMTGDAFIGNGGESEVDYTYGLWEGAGPTLPVISSSERLQEFMLSSSSLRGTGACIVMSALRSIALELRKERGIPCREDEICLQLEGRKARLVGSEVEYDYISSKFDTTNPAAFNEIGNLLFDRCAD